MKKEEGWSREACILKAGDHGRGPSAKKEEEARVESGPNASVKRSTIAEKMAGMDG